MEKALMVLGGIFLVLLVLAGVGIAFAVTRGTALDKEAKAYVDAAVPAIVSGWNEQELISRASPGFMEAIKQGQLDKVYDFWRRVGVFQAYNGSQGESKINYGNKGIVISAAFTASATFDTGPATIEITLVKHNDWKIIGLVVKSKVLFNHHIEKV